MFHLFLNGQFKKRFLVISLLMLALDMMFVALNYRFSQQALDESIREEGLHQKRDIELILSMSYRNMTQIATQLAAREDLSQLFLQGMKAVQREGGGAGGEESQQIRQALFNKLKAEWSVMSEKFMIRQIHYHLGPDSLSFLRVHMPEKFGDQLKDVRHTVVDTNQQQKPHTGFETGRVYSGLRAVIPVFAYDSETERQVHVGALEVGTSLSQLLDIYSQQLDVSSAIFLTYNHVQHTMWPEMIAKRMGAPFPECKWYLEASSTSRSEITEMVNQLYSKAGQCDVKQSFILPYQDKSYAVNILPLRDYLGDKDSQLPPVGAIFTWHDVSHEVADFWSNVFKNLLYSLLAFLLLDWVVFHFLRLELKRKEAMHMAWADGLTGLNNRRALDLHLAKVLQKARRTKQSVSLIMCDVDHFKSYNDTYGHTEGDHCLQKLARQFQQSTKQKGFAARYGGEEFIIVLTDESLEQASAFAVQLKDQIERLAIPHKHNQNGVVTVSMGVSTTSNGCGSSEELLKAADRCLYTAKASGRNRVLSHSTLDTLEMA